MALAGLIKTVTVALALFAFAVPSGAGAKAAARGDEGRLSEAGIRTALPLARAARSAGDLPAAIALYRVIVHNGAEPGVQVEFADALLDGGLIDDAIGVYLAVDPLSPAELSALLGLQRAYERLSDPQKALTYAQRAATLAPADARARVGLGVALDAVGRHREAQASYRLALGSAPRSIAARNDLALSLAMTGQFPEAIELLTPIARSANAPSRVRQNLALIYGLNGDPGRALALSQADLPAPAAQANLRFFEYARAHGQ